jgi:hypothetical protein
VFVGTQCFTKKYIVYGTKLQLTTSRVRRTLIFFAGDKYFSRKCPRKIGIPTFEISDLNLVVLASLKPVNVPGREHPLSPRFGPKKCLEHLQRPSRGALHVRIAYTARKRAQKKSIPSRHPASNPSYNTKGQAESIVAFHLAKLLRGTTPNTLLIR